MNTIGDFFAEQPLDFSKLRYADDTQLRDYQVENKKKVYEAWTKYRSVMLQMPTGTGKTKLFTSILKDLHNLAVAQKRQIKSLVLVHREELLDQASEELGVKYGLAHGFIHSGDREQKRLPNQLASVQTLNRRLDNWRDKKFDVIIIDEAHHVKAESYTKIINQYPKAKILGVTATPYRLNGAGFRTHFDTLICSYPVSEFINKGYLCDYEYYSISNESKEQSSIDNMAVGFDGDYKDEAMMDIMDTDNIRARIVDTYLKYAKGKKGIVYTVNKAHNVHIKDEFNTAGVKAEAIDSDTSQEEREALIRKFKAGQIDVLCNVNIFSEGFDCPDVECIQLARPTKSLSMYLQQVGRGLRPAEGKDKVIILDNVGLYNKFGFPSARRKWKYHFEGKDDVEEYYGYGVEKDDEDNRDCYIIDIAEGEEEVQLLFSSQGKEIDVQGEESLMGDIEAENYQEESQDYTNAFRKYLEEQGWSEFSIDNTIDGLKCIDELIKKEIELTHSSVFNTIDVEYIKKLYEKLKLHREYWKYNSKYYGRPGKSIEWYMDFASSYNENVYDIDDVDEIDQEELINEVEYVENVDDLEEELTLLKKHLDDARKLKLSTKEIEDRIESVSEKINERAFNSRKKRIEEVLYKLFESGCMGDKTFSLNVKYNPEEGFVVMSSSQKDENIVDEGSCEINLHENIDTRSIIKLVGNYKLQDIIEAGVCEINSHVVRFKGGKESGYGTGKKTVINVEIDGFLYEKIAIDKIKSIVAKSL